MSVFFSFPDLGVLQFEYLLHPVRLEKERIELRDQKPVPSCSKAINVSPGLNNKQGLKFADLKRPNRVILT